MKKSAIKKAIMGLGLITSVIFTSCAKKSEDPKPKNVTIITPNNISTNDSLYTYLNQGDSSIINALNNKIWFPTKIDGDTLDTSDSIYTMSDYYNHNLIVLDFTKLLVCNNLKEFNFLKRNMIHSYSVTQNKKIMAIIKDNNYNYCTNIMKNKNGLYSSLSNEYKDYDKYLQYYIKIINKEKIIITYYFLDGNSIIEYTSRKIVNYEKEI